MRTGVQEINFTGITGETVTLDVTDTSAFEYRVAINTSAEITGVKAIAFTGSAFSGCMMVFNVIGGINTAGASKFTINGDPVPDVNALRPCMIYYRFNGSTWNRQILGSAGGSPFIPGSDLIDNSVPAVKLQNDIAGDGMDRDINGGVIPNLEAVQPSLQVSATELGVKLDSSRAITKDSNGIGVELEITDPSLQISTNELGVKIAATGGLEKTSSGMEVKLDPIGDITSTVDGLRFGACVCIKEITIAVNSSTILNLFTVPLELVAAPGPKKYIDVISATVRVTLGSVYTANTKLIIQTKNAPGQMFESDCLGTAVQRFYKFDQVPLVSDADSQIIDNAPLNLTVDTGNPTGGTSTLELSLIYRIITGIA